MPGGAGLRLRAVSLHFWGSLMHIKVEQMLVTGSELRVPLSRMRLGLILCNLYLIENFNLGA